MTLYKGSWNNFHTLLIRISLFNMLTFLPSIVPVYCFSNLLLHHHHHHQQIFPFKLLRVIQKSGNQMPLNSGLKFFRTPSDTTNYFSTHPHVTSQSQLIVLQYQSIKCQCGRSTLHLFSWIHSDHLVDDYRFSKNVFLQHGDDEWQHYIW